MTLFPYWGSCFDIDGDQGYMLVLWELGQAEAKENTRAPEPEMSQNRDDMERKSEEQQTDVR